MMKLIRTLTILALLIPCVGNAVTHIVDIDGSGQYTSIQAALDASASGDTVLVYPGRYFENLVIQTNNISLISMEAITNNPAFIDSTVIDGSRTSSVVAIGQNRQNIVVRGFTITNGKGNGINFGPDSIGFLTNCHILDNIASNGGGVTVACALVTLSGVSIHGNYAVNLGGGIYVMSGGDFVCNVIFDSVNRCSIYNNRSGSGQDIYIQEATSNLNMYLDTFSVAVPTSYYVVFLSENNHNCNLNIDILNAHHQEINQDIYVSPNGNDSNDGLSPDTPLKTIHEGIYRIAADSLNQKTVHLLPGTYSRTSNDQVLPIALKSWVKVQGSGIDTTAVVGENHPLLSVGDNPNNDVFMSFYQNVVSLSNMSITTLNSNNDTVVYGNSFGSMNLSYLRIHNVNPDDLSAIWIYLNSEYESIWDNVIIENVLTPDMGLVDIGGSMRGSISNSKFRNATSTYTSASVWAYPLVSFRGDQYLTFDNCEFTNLTMLDNDASAIQVGAVQFPQQQNIFSFNNCLFSNINSPGSIMLVGSSGNPNVYFNNCTFAGNVSDNYTLMVNGNVNITNSILYNDTPYQIKINPMNGNPNELTTMNIDYSCIKDGIAGIQQAPGNTINFLPTSISSNPFFLGGDDIPDPLYYSLSAASPCINSGTPDTTGLDLLPYDLAENWRIWDGRIDMGCYEFGSAPWVTNDDPVLPVPEQLTLYQNYPNPFNPSTTISFHLPKATACKVEIFNIRGQKVKTLLSGTMLSGKHSFIWDGEDESGRAVSSGVYCYRLITPQSSQLGKMLMVK